MELIDIIGAGITFVIFLISALPLQKAVKWIKKKRPKYLLALAVVFFSGIIVGIINLFFPIYIGLISTITLIYIYKRVFKIRKYRQAFYIWGLHFIFVLISSTITQIILNIIF